jgi:hypothetical protein
MKIVFLSAALSVFLAGCAPTQTLTQGRQEVSSGRIGCSPADIKITDTGDRTWIAQCREKVFYCTAGSSGSCKAKLE